MDVRGMSDEAGGLRAADAIADFSRVVGLPGSLREVGVPGERPAGMRRGGDVGRVNRVQREARDGSRRGSRRAEGRLVSAERSAAARSAPLAEAPISLAPGTEDAGLASMLADLLRQNLQQQPGKKRDFERLRTTVAIEARDAEVTITLEFLHGALVVHPGALGAPKVRISADSATVLELTTLRIAGGLPMLFDAGGRRLIGKLVAGELEIKGLFRHLPSLLRLTRLMSVNG